jgi:hypothetical protein
MIQLAVEATDNRSRKLLEEMLASEEEHQHWLESQLELIRQIVKRIISPSKFGNPIRRGSNATSEGRETGKPAFRPSILPMPALDALLPQPAHWFYLCQ